MGSHLPIGPLTVPEGAVARIARGADGEPAGGGGALDGGPAAAFAASAASARADARLGLYVHVPFCAHRCAYCDFSSGAITSGAIGRYLYAMEREMGRRAPSAAGLSFTSVFFGGGTPSALSARAFRRLWRNLRAHFQLDPRAEITLEANPESVRPPLLEAWAEAGVNRLSIGAQSFDAEELRMLGRIHAVARPAGAFALARAHGFRRLSLDLMFGFPRSNAARLAITLERALELEPEHLSAYCYIPEPGTPLGDAVGSGSVALPAPDEQADSYALLSEQLNRAGFACYETSNFSRPAGEARHNLVYWLRRPYLGLGPSAHGLHRGIRYGNHRTLARWVSALESGDAPEAEFERETETSVAQEVMMLGLRLADGLRRSDYAAGAWHGVLARYGRAFAHALAAGRLERAGAGIRVPAALRFVADDVIAWIEAESERARFDSRAASFLPSVTCRSLHSPAV